MESTTLGRRGRGAVLALAASALALLSACDSLPFGRGAGADTAADTTQSVELVERDVEAPEVFQVTEDGLWDGRPSLGGVWVAHPDVGEPERVIIRNQANGKFVVGALFRRERDNPGPALQVSSDAAEALGMLAGSPAELNVTALRREEASEPAPDATVDPVTGEPVASPETDPAALAASGEITAQPLDGAVTTAALAAITSNVPQDGVIAATPAPSDSSSLERPFIQLGIFSIEANANGLVQDLDAKGLPARMIESSTQGQTIWRVLVGPAQTEGERAAWLDQVKAEGFADAYFVRN